MARSFCIEHHSADGLNAHLSPETAFSLLKAVTDTCFCIPVVLCCG